MPERMEPGDVRADRETIMLTNIYIHSRVATIEQTLLQKEAERQARIDEAMRDRRPAAARRPLRIPRPPLDRLASTLRPFRAALRLTSSSST